MYLKLNNITQRFGTNEVLKDLSLTVERGEFVSFLGPSGCGKSTILRIIAGFATVSSGTVELENRDISALPPNRRETSMVFQGYALFPHMTVFDNVAYGLRRKKVKGDELTSRVQEALEATQMLGFAKRYPAQLSGGQQQRVALSRSLALRPAVLLLDEPLSNLDAGLREDLRQQIRSLHDRFALTTIFVTHDQQEAFALSDRVIVLEQGAIVQSGKPREIYGAPKTEFVARFTGVKNFFSGEARKNALVLSDGTQLKVDGTVSAESRIGLRSANIRFGTVAEACDNQLTGAIVSTSYRGETVEILVEVLGQEVLGTLPASDPIALQAGPGTQILLGWDVADQLLLHS